ncbi:N-acylphosphatidylethanolamine synthase-like isoform X3 [Panicum virgatum]|uniref:Tafazzin family protein n=1 Tax=Panicum virgatum TaxID=38727 RepID=A0A8T0Q6A0_PANVG|nr:N-acylphosphatidylethanolamine synthase-like isoform X3 [Panicum virgatum]KAG2569583.1 hypothetical protein PVAP13_7NG429800 [Panicum virgatum]
MSSRTSGFVQGADPCPGSGCFEFDVLTLMRSGNHLLDAGAAEDRDLHGRPVCLSSRVDDPLMWGFKGFPTSDAMLGRWVLTAEDICFRNVVMSYVFRLGKCVPITRGGGIYQEHMNEALDVLVNGGWLHSFPEGKIAQDDQPIRRLKWGTPSLIVRAPITPIVLPIVHSGFEKVMPENLFFGRRPPVPLWGKKIDIIIGEPIEFDMASLKQEAAMVPHDPSSVRKGWPTITPGGLDEAAQRWLYQKMSDKIQSVMERLRKKLLNLKQH